MRVSTICSGMQRAHAHRVVVLRCYNAAAIKYFLHETGKWAGNCFSRGVEQLEISDVSDHMTSCRYIFQTFRHVALTYIPCSDGSPPAEAAQSSSFIRTAALHSSPEAQLPGGREEICRKGTAPAVSLARSEHCIANGSIASRMAMPSAARLCLALHFIGCARSRCSSGLRQQSHPSRLYALFFSLVLPVQCLAWLESCSPLPK